MCQFARWPFCYFVPVPDSPFVGRGGLKLRHALTEFGVDPTGWVCADFGSNIGGFTDCLLQAGAAKVHAVDTGYGNLAWRLRNDPRVAVMERTNALHAPPPVEGGVSLVVMDLGWTPQRHAVPAALRWLAPDGKIISLVKPHYELERPESGLLVRGILDPDHAERIAERTAAAMPEYGARLLGLTRSPIAGGASKGNSKGNAEWLALLERA
jgi:23S rRNA (cytidine1920-2'-O)/16S rRNA (cytidine1409-2'-O)-methyltransferase